MNTIAEPRHQIPATEVESGKGPQPKPGLTELWLAILAMGAVVALVAAVALGAVGNSEKTNTFESLTVLDPRADADVHRIPAAAAHPQAYEELAGPTAVASASYPQAYEELAKSTAVDPRMDSDFHRQASGPASSPEASPHYVNGGLTSEEFWAVYGQADDSTDPRQDADHHREASN